MVIILGERWTKPNIRRFLLTMDHTNEKKVLKIAILIY